MPARKAKIEGRLVELMNPNIGVEGFRVDLLPYFPDDNRLFLTDDSIIILDDQEVLSSAVVGEYGDFEFETSVSNDLTPALNYNVQVTVPETHKYPGEYTFGPFGLGPLGGNLSVLVRAGKLPDDKKELIARWAFADDTSKIPLSKLPAAFAGIVIEDEEGQDPIQPSEDTFSKILYRNGVLYRTEKEGGAGPLFRKSVTADFQGSIVPAPGFALTDWFGVVSKPLIPVEAGDFWYWTGSPGHLTIVKNDLTTGSFAINPNKFVGQWETEDEAWSHITASGQLAIYRKPDGNYDMFTSTGVPTAVTYKFEAISGEPWTREEIEALFQPGLNSLSSDVRQVEQNVKSINEYLASTIDGFPYRVYRSNGQVGIVQKEDLDGDYLLVIKDLDAMLPPDARNTLAINEVRIFVADSSGTGNQVHTETFAYVPGPAIVPFNISPSEEGNTRLQQNLATTPGFVRFAVAFYGDNVIRGVLQYYSMHINAKFQPLQSGSGTDQVARDKITILEGRTESITKEGAEAGTGVNVGLWSPKRIAEAIAALAPSGEGLTREQLFNILPPFLDMRLEPAGIPGIIYPETIDLLLDSASGDDRTISDVSLLIGLDTVTGTRRLSSTGGIVSFTLSQAIRDRLESNTPRTDKSRQVTITFTRSDSSTVSINVEFLVNNPNFVELPEVSKTDAEEGTSTTFSSWSPERVKEAIVSNLLPKIQALASGNAVAWNFDIGEIADLVLGHNATLSMSGGVNGNMALLRVTQDSTGSRTLTLGTGITRNGPEAPVLSTTGGEIDLLMFHRLGTGWRYIGIIKNV